ncbi:MAG TPA: hypothetical protein DD473_13945 [Planctomycetaceae bacterium]|nr:hypothetical protein [Planctomycetaceae bacterium]
MNIPGIGAVTKDEELDWYYSEPIAIPVLGAVCQVVVEGYDDDPNKEDFHTAINNFLSAGHTVLKEAEPYIYQYYERCRDYYDPSDDEYVDIKSSNDIWQHIRLGVEPTFTRRAYGDKGIYVSLECSCDWEQEHGLQIVFKNGWKVNKVGAYDGHVTNSDAYADDILENVIFK